MGGGEGWNMAAKLCDSCKSATATLFCRADSAFLCLGCDAKIHAANKMASRHARVWMCEVCEQAPASVTCKADAAALCTTCDRDIHTANPLASRHERFPVTPFYESPDASKASAVDGGAEERYFSDLDGGEAEEAEAESWLLLNPNPKVVDGPDLKNNSEYVFSDMDPYLDLDLMAGDQKPQRLHQHQKSAIADGVVPVQPPSVVEGLPCYDVGDYGSKPFMYNFSTQSISQSVSSSSLEVGVVPDHNTLTDVSTATTTTTTYGVPAHPGTAIDREARVMRYREKRKNRKFEKTIRYASRKAYAETRPRIKGRFAKRPESADVHSSPTFGVVPSF